MPSTSSFCPACGALLKPGDKQCWCWLCFQELSPAPPQARRFLKDLQLAPDPGADTYVTAEAVAPAVQGSRFASPNRFAEQPDRQPPYNYTSNTRAVLGKLLAILAIGPATAAAFLTTCAVFLVSDDEVARGNAQERAMGYIVVALIPALVVFALFCMLIVSLNKKTMRRVEP